MTEISAVPKRSSVALALAIGNAALSCVAGVSLFAAAGFHLSKDVPDGGVIFMVWTGVVSPLVSVVSIGAGLSELRVPGPRRVRSWVGMGISAFLIIATGVVWTLLLRPR